MMLAVGTAPETVRTFFEELDYPSNELSIACYNSPDSVTVSGTRNAVTALESKLSSMGVFSRYLRTGNKAYHSPLISSVGELYERECLEALKLVQSFGRKYVSDGITTTTMISSVNLKTLDNNAVKPAYWRANLESPVMFQQAVEILIGKLLESENIQFVEIGPHPALSGPVRETTKLVLENRGNSITTQIQHIPTLARGKDAEECMLKAAGTLYLRGQALDFAKLNVQHRTKHASSRDCEYIEGKTIVDLPGYCWNYSTLHWVENRWSEEWKARKYPRHDLLGSVIPASTSNPRIWRNILLTKNLPWLLDHKV